MAIEYCARGDHYFDLDWYSEGEYIDLEFCCWDCLTEEEQEASENS